VDIQWLQIRGHDAEAEILALPPHYRGKALALLGRLATQTRAQFRIKPTYVPNVFEAKAGDVRLLFVHGKNGVTWCIGGFVKTDTKHGNRALQSYASLAQLAANL
jgi:hypothetical protein